MYIRVSTRRYGPTPFGMWLYLYPMKFSLSTFYEYGASDCSIPFFKCNFDYQNFERYYYYRLVEYLDSIVAARSQPLSFEDLPSDRLWINHNVHDSLYSRYFDKLYVNDTAYVWVERGGSPRVGDWHKSQNNSISTKTFDGLSITYFYDAETKSLLFRSNKKYQNCIAKVYNILGELLWEYFPLNISDGINKVSFPSSIINNSVAIVQITDSKGNSIVSMKVILR